MTEPDLLEHLPPAAIHDRLGIQITAARPDQVVGTMPVAGNTQPYGLLHGGASILLAESLASIAAAIAAGPDNLVMGIEVNASHHRSARSGIVRGTATPLHRGRTLSTWSVTITDEDGRTVCTARVTCIVRPAQAG